MARTAADADELADRTVVPPPGVTVQRSPIHGRGLFAARRFEVGEMILDWSQCAERLTSEQVDRLPVEERRFLSFIDGTPVLFHPPARFVNHSCEPNAKGELGRDVALRVIEVGEEVTVDYVVEQVPDLALRCTCGSSRCRGALRSPGL